MLVLKNDGDGTFTNGPTLPVGAGNQPSTVAIGDFNGDGVGDLAVTIYKLSTVPNLLVFLNNGTGTSFSGPTTYSTGSGPFGIAAAKFNGDTSDDVLVTSSDSSELSVLRCNGNGTFQAAQTVGVGSGARDVAVADFNGDGNKDAAVANYAGGQVTVLFGDGTGALTSTQTFEVAANAWGVAAADFNEDGKQDIVATSEIANTAHVLLGTGGGGFAPAEAASRPPRLSLGRARDPRGRSGAASAAATGSPTNPYRPQGKRERLRSR